MASIDELYIQYRYGQLPDDVTVMIVPVEKYYRTFRVVKEYGLAPYPMERMITSEPPDLFIEKIELEERYIDGERVVIGYGPRTKRLLIGRWKD